MLLSQLYRPCMTLNCMWFHLPPCTCLCCTTVLSVPYHTWSYCMILYSTLTQQGNNPLHSTNIYDSCRLCVRWWQYTYSTDYAWTCSTPQQGHHRWYLHTLVVSTELVRVRVKPGKDSRDHGRAREEAICLHTPFHFQMVCVWERESLQCLHYRSTVRISLMYCAADVHHGS